MKVIRIKTMNDVFDKNSDCFCPLSIGTMHTHSFSGWSEVDVPREFIIFLCRIKPPPSQYASMRFTHSRTKQSRRWGCVLGSFVSGLNSSVYERAEHQFVISGSYLGNCRYFPSVTHRTTHPLTNIFIVCNSILLKTI